MHMTFIQSQGLLSKLPNIDRRNDSYAAALSCELLIIYDNRIGCQREAGLAVIWPSSSVKGSKLYKDHNACIVLWGRDHMNRERIDTQENAEYDLCKCEHEMQN